MGKAHHIGIRALTIAFVSHVLLLESISLAGDKLPKWRSKCSLVHICAKRPHDVEAIKLSTNACNQHNVRAQLRKATNKGRSIVTVKHGEEVPMHLANIVANEHVEQCSGVNGKAHHQIEQVHAHI